MIGGDVGILVGDVLFGLVRRIDVSESLPIGLSFGIEMLIPLCGVEVEGVLGAGNFGVLICCGGAIDLFGLKAKRFASFALLFNSFTIALMSELEHLSEITIGFGDVAVPLLILFASSAGMSGNFTISMKLLTGLWCFVRLKRGLFDVGSFSSLVNVIDNDDGKFMLHEFNSD